MKKPCRILSVGNTINRDIVKEIVHFKNLAPTLVISKDINNHSVYARYIPKNYIFTKVNNKFIDIIKKIDFKTFTRTLRNEINEKDNSISELYSRYLSEISSREFLFNRKDLLLKTLDKIKLQDLIDFINEKITSKSKINLINLIIKFGKQKK